MTASTHLLFGAAAVIVLGRPTGIYPSAVDLLVVMFGALAPDIDGGGAISRPGNFLPRILPRPLIKLLNGFGLIASKAVRSVSRHRGFFHWPIVALGLFLLSAFLNQPALFWFSVGYLSHLLADLCTKGGIPVFAPISRKAFSVLPIRTGSIAERVIAIGIGCGLALYGWVLVQSGFLLPLGK